MDHRERAYPPTRPQPNSTQVTTEIRGRFKVVGSASPNAKGSHRTDRDLAAPRRRVGRDLPSSMRVQSNGASNGIGRPVPSSMSRPPRDMMGDGMNRPATRGASLMQGSVIGPTELVKRGTSMMRGSAMSGTMSPGVLRVLAEESRSDCGIIVEKRMKSRTTAKQVGKKGYGYCTDSWGTVDESESENYGHGDGNPNGTAGGFK